jgi:hypothetical protein
MAASLSGEPFDEPDHVGEVQELARSENTDGPVVLLVEVSRRRVDHDASFRMQVSRTTRKVGPRSPQRPSPPLRLDGGNRRSLGQLAACVLAMRPCEGRRELEAHDFPTHDGRRVHRSRVHHCRRRQRRRASREGAMRGCRHTSSLRRRQRPLRHDPVASRAPVHTSAADRAFEPRPFGPAAMVCFLAARIAATTGSRPSATGGPSTRPASELETRHLGASGGTRVPVHGLR